MGIPVDICEPWTTPDRLCCPDLTTVDCATDVPEVGVYIWSDVELIDVATSILFKQTCHLFPGHCQITVRPCVHCSCRSRERCDCGRYSYISLQEKYPVISVDEVLIDGVVLAPAAYRVDDYQRLVRVDGECWPRCNDLSEPDTSPNTLAVTYTAGRRPPVELQMAAAELACELKRACNLQDCRLPSNVTSVNRQGVSLNIDALETAMGAGTSGLAIVDAAIRRYDCQRSKSRVSHPGLRSPRQVFPS